LAPVSRSLASAKGRAHLRSGGSQYTIANAVPGEHPQQFSTQSSQYDAEGVEYFDVYSPVIRTRYSQVYWTMMEPVKLPDDIVSRFAGKAMAITGHEADQVMKGAGPNGEDVSVPITWVRLRTALSARVCPSVSPSVCLRLRLSA
jgi:hypothetical protein